LRLSTKGIYGVLAVLDLTVHQTEGFVSLRSIADRHRLSESYLEQLFSVLRKKGILTGARGSQGGYALKKDPKNITVGMVLEALEGPLKLLDCKKGSKECNRYDFCITRRVWDRLGGAIGEVVNNITLQDLADDYKAQGLKGQHMFYI
jgi:Rrf2 family cysteine metabolism transcriptional repressor